METKKKVLIMCTGNSARSQMAEGLLRHDAGDRFEVESAGVIKTYVRPQAIAVMKEIGIDISGQWSKSVDELSGRRFDVIITVCDHAKEHCPYFPGDAVRIHKNFTDPAAVAGDEETKLAAFRRVRDEIREWLGELARKYA
jgi:arsenate reductase